MFKAMGSTVFGVPDSGLRRPLLAAVLLSPMILTACVSSEGAMTGLAEAGQPAPTAAAEASAAEETTSVAEAAAAADEGSASVVAYSAQENGTISGSAAIDRMIEQAAAENGLPRELAFAVVRVESHYNPRAKGSGVYGLSQIKPATARSMGFDGPAEALYDPATNLRYGMRYLKGAWERGNKDVCQTSMKYKGGHRATTMTRSAQAYCSNVKRHMAAITGRPAAVSTLDPVQVASIPAERPVESRVEATAPVPAAANALAPAQAAATTPARSAIAESVREAAVRPGAELPAQMAKPSVDADVAVVSATAAVETAAVEPDPARFGN